MTYDRNESDSQKSDPSLETPGIPLADMVDDEPEVDEHGRFVNKNKGKGKSTKRNSETMNAQQ